MALKGIDELDDQYYIHNRRLLIIVGLWPYQKKSERLFYGWLIGLLMCAASVLQTYVLLASKLKMDSLIDLLQFYLPTLCFLHGYYNQHYNCLTFKMIFQRVRNDWAKIENEKELKVMLRYSRECRLCCLTIAGLFYIYIAFAILPFISSYILYLLGRSSYPQFVLLVPVTYCENDKFCSAILFVIEFFVAIVVCTVGIAIYTIFISLVQHACALLHIVAIKIDQPFMEDQYHTWKMIFASKRQADYEWIVSIIKCYNNAITFFDVLKVSYGKQYTVGVFMTVLFLITDFFYFLGIELQIFHFLTLAKSMKQLLKTFSYVAANCLMIYAIFYLCQRLLDHSANIYTKFCQTPFYELSIKTQRVLPLLILRSTKSINFSCSGIFVASYEMLGKIMKMSFSFATVCYNTR